MSLKFKIDKPIIGREVPEYNFGKITGNFIITSVWGEPNFEVYIDGNIFTGDLISVNDQEVKLVPFDSGSYVFALNSSFKLTDSPSLDLLLQSGSYYEIDQVDCNFKLSINAEAGIHVYLKCNGEVLVDTDSVHCDIEWLAEGTSVFQVTSTNNKQIPAELRRS